jgi:pimeloyl-ACP methyl ester carboxylesterase
MQRLVGMTVALTSCCVGVGKEEATGSVDDADAASSDEDPAADSNEVPGPGMPTLGGLQFWGDLKYFHGFRIQRNVLNGGYRLLDKSNRRYASGTREDCESALEKIQIAQGLPPEVGHAVIYLHGIGRTSRSLRPIMKVMQQSGIINVPFEYPSTRVPIRQSAEFLQSVVESLTDVSRISFVVHSMGGLVVRRLLLDYRDSRFHRMVMLGTPNNGAQLADMLRNNFLFKHIYGPAGQELVTDPDGTIQTLPVPSFEFGIIAGGKGDDRGFNRLLPGDDDGTVTVASARLAGARDYLRVARIHAMLMSDATVLTAVPHFLEHGQFFPDRNPDPIE